MARNKDLMVRDIKRGLEQALHVLNSVENLDDMTFEEARSAASSATQAGAELHRLSGMIDVETAKKGK